MKHFAAGAMLALSCLGLPCQRSSPERLDLASVPEIKRSKLQLYHSPRKPTRSCARTPRTLLFLDVRTRRGHVRGHASPWPTAWCPTSSTRELMNDWDERPICTS